MVIKILIFARYVSMSTMKFRVDNRTPMTINNPISP